MGGMFGLGQQRWFRPAYGMAPWGTTTLSPG
jgi:hypothetical protein